MSIEDNKRVVMTWFEKLRAGDLDGAWEQFDEGLTWRCFGNMVISGEFGRQALRDNMVLLSSWMPGGFEIWIKSITAEGERVVVENESRGRDAAGNEIYHNHYVLLLVVRDGKIVSGTEYLDTQHAAEALGPLGAVV